MLDEKLHQSLNVGLDRYSALPLIDSNIPDIDIGVGTWLMILNICSLFLGFPIILGYWYG